jgi:5,10-methylenetetrahydrofolate reductase
MKIIDKLNAKLAAGEPFFSFEFFPPRTEEVGHCLHCRQPH